MSLILFFISCHLFYFFIQHVFLAVIIETKSMIVVLFNLFLCFFFIFMLVRFVNFGLKICSFSSNSLIRRLSLNVVYYFLKFLYYDTFLVERIRYAILRKRKMYITTMEDLNYRSILEYRYERLETPFSFKPLSYVYCIPSFRIPQKKHGILFYYQKFALTVGIFFLFNFFLIPNMKLIEFLVINLHKPFFFLIYDLKPAIPSYNWWNTGFMNQMKLLSFFLLRSFVLVWNYFYYTIYNLILDWRLVHKKNTFFLLLHENAYLSHLLLCGPISESLLILQIYNEIYVGIGFEPIGVPVGTHSIFSLEAGDPADFKFAYLKQKHRLANMIYTPYYKLASSRKIMPVIKNNKFIQYFL